MGPTRIRNIDSLESLRCGRFQLTRFQDKFTGIQDIFTGSQRNHSPLGNSPGYRNANIFINNLNISILGEMIRIRARLGFPGAEGRGSTGGVEAHSLVALVALVAIE